MKSTTIFFLLFQHPCSSSMSPISSWSGLVVSVRHLRHRATGATTLIHAQGCRYVVGQSGRAAASFQAGDHACHVHRDGEPSPDNVGDKVWGQDQTRKHAWMLCTPDKNSMQACAEPPAGCHGYGCVSYVEMCGRGCKQKLIKGGFSMGSGMSRN